MMLCGVSQELSISVHVDYSGGLWIGIDADLVSVCVCACMHARVCVTCMRD